MQGNFTFIYFKETKRRVSLYVQCPRSELEHAVFFTISKTDVYICLLILRAYCVM